MGKREAAEARAYAERKGWTLEWEFDPEPYEMGDAETEMPSEVLGCVLKDVKGNHLASLWGIGDPDHAHAREVEVDLILEARAEAIRDMLEF